MIRSNQFLLTASVTALLVATATAATAQEAASTTSAEQIGEVVVTGSRIQRRDATAVGPLTTVTSVSSMS